MTTDKQRADLERLLKHRIETGRGGHSDKIALAVLEERDDLAAHQADLVRELTSCQAVLHSLARAGEVTPEYADEAKAVLKRTKETSLARLKAEWQAEALHALADLWERDVTVVNEHGEYEGAVVTTTSDWVRARGDEYRRQAEQADKEPTR